MTAAAATPAPSSTSTSSCPRCGGETRAGVRVTYRDRGELVNLTLPTRYCPPCGKTVDAIALDLELAELHEKHAAAARRVAQLVEDVAAAKAAAVANSRPGVANSSPRSVANNPSGVANDEDRALQTLLQTILARRRAPRPPPTNAFKGGERRTPADVARAVVEVRDRALEHGISLTASDLAEIFEGEASRSAIHRILQNPERYGAAAATGRRRS